MTAEEIAQHMVNAMAEGNVRQLPWEDLDEGSRDLFVEALEDALDMAGVQL